MEPKSFGLSPKNFQQLKILVIDPLLATPTTQVWIFGSRVRGTFKQYSDIDLLVDSQSEKIQEALSAVMEAIEESPFPYKVDFVLLKNLANSYREQVLRERVSF